MKAIRLHGYSGFDSIRFEDVPGPEPGPNEAVVRLHASSVNHLELFSLHPNPLEPADRPPSIPGCDGAGVIEKLGEGVEGWSVGDEVIINPNLGDPEQDGYAILGVETPGTHAESIALPAANLIAKPSALSFEEAASLPLCLMTAWRQVVVKGDVRPGEWVLIHGIGGGVAVHCLQIAKLAGAQVIVSSGDEAKLGKARTLGADHTLNYRHQDVVGEVARITGGRGVDLVIDNVGAATFAVSLAVSAIGGRVATVGNLNITEPVSFNPSPVIWKSLTIFGSLMGSTAELETAIATAGAGKIKPVIDSVFPLEDYRLALERMESAKKFGKIIISRD